MTRPGREDQCTSICAVCRIRIAELRAEASAEVEILGAPDLIVVPEPVEVVLNQLEAQPRIDELAILGHEARRHGSGASLNSLSSYVAPTLQRRTQPFSQTVRPAPEPKRTCDANETPRRPCPGRTTAGCARRPADTPAAQRVVERIERPFDFQRPQRAVAVVRVRGLYFTHELKTCRSWYSISVESRSTPDLRAIARSVPVPRKLSSSSSMPAVFSPPLRLNEMPGFSVQTSCVVTAMSTRRRGTRPAGSKHRKIAGRAQDARRLFEQALRVGIAALEQQLLTNDVRLGANVQFVRQPVELFVLLGILHIEDVLVVNEDFTDDGPRRSSSAASGTVDSAATGVGSGCSGDAGHHRRRQERDFG